MKNLHQQVLELLPQCIEDRRWLHRHAELSFREYKTADYLEQALCELEGLELSRPTPTSVMAVLRTGRPGRCLAIRADIDALPIREENELDYRSCNEGVMHACGHDGHAAILLNSVRLLCRRREELCGELRFIFQHAEETPPGGAVEVIRAGVLKGVDEVFGLHLTSTLPTGSFGVCSGVLTSATDRFEIEIHTFSGVQLRLACASIIKAQGRPEPAGQAKITRAYNLPCRYVLHTVGPAVAGAPSQKDRDLLASCYRSCLALAEKHGLRSIAFCCISTGEFHFPRREAAEIAVKTVKEYLNASPGLLVVFNVFTEEDHKIYHDLLRPLKHR